MRALEALRPGLPTVACFDTAFHADDAAGRLDLRGAGRVDASAGRCGATASTASPTPTRAGAPPSCSERPVEQLRLVTAHLGAGASLAAVQGGRSVDTTMGFTPLEGLVMATRSGSVDPGLLLWVQRHGGIERRGDGARARPRSRACSASRPLRRHARDRSPASTTATSAAASPSTSTSTASPAAIAAMAAAMGGIDALVFTGGVGENAAAGALRGLPLARLPRHRA